MNIVVVGHVDHGKSTLIGRLLYDTNSLPEDAIERVKAISKEKGKRFEYAYLLDAFEEEQKQGITIDTTNIKFSSDKRDYVIIDAPGHKEFLKNMISGASSAEAALLLIDSNEGIQEQSRRHGYILSLLGIEKVFVVINKMDLVNYDEEVYKKIVSDFSEFLNNLNIYPQGYIPIAAINGENLVNRSENLSWYTGQTIVESIDSLDVDKKNEDKPFRLPIQDVYKFDHRRIIAGRVEAGTLKKGDKVVVYPNLKETVVESIEEWESRNGENLEVNAGQSVGITFKDEFFNKRGEIVIKKGEEEPFRSNIFNASLFWMGKESLKVNQKYKIKLVTAETECEIVSINKIIDTSTLEKVEIKNELRRNDVGEVTIKTKDVITFDLFSKIATTGRFVIVDKYDVSGGGIVTSVEDTLANRAVESKTETVVLKKRLVTRKEREERLDQKGQVIWLTGLPGSGKNEIAIKLEKKLFELGNKVYYLNPSALRYGLSQDLTISEDDRREETRRLAEVANILVDNGLIVIVTAINIKARDRELAKNIIGEKRFKEIFIDAPKEVCVSRSNGNEIAKAYEYEKSVEITNTIFIEKEDFNSNSKAESIVKFLGY